MRESKSAHDALSDWRYEALKRCKKSRPLSRMIRCSIRNCATHEFFVGPESDLTSLLHRG
jgi:hypothetical protein